MKQYCRYCALYNQVDDDICYCSESKQTFSGAKARRVNKCKSFLFNEIDVFDLGHKYKTMEDRKQPQKTGHQISIFTEEI